MDGDGDKQNKVLESKGKKINFLQRYITNVSDVLSPIWIRRTIQIVNGSEWFILGSRYYFLLNFRLLLVIVYILYEIYK